eukprot:240958-Rhodomonas_salina.2
MLTGPRTEQRTRGLRVDSGNPRCLPTWALRHTRCSRRVWCCQRPAGAGNAVCILAGARHSLDESDLELCRRRKVPALWGGSRVLEQLQAALLLLGSPRCPSVICAVRA